MPGLLQQNDQVPAGTAETKKRVVQILDAKYEMADLQAAVNTTASHHSLHDQSKLLDFLM